MRVKWENGEIQQVSWDGWDRRTEQSRQNDTRKGLRNYLCRNKTCLDLNPKCLSASIRWCILENKTVVLKFSMDWNHLTHLFKHRLLGLAQASDFMVQGWGPRICISNKLCLCWCCFSENCPLRTTDLGYKNSFFNEKSEKQRGKQRDSLKMRQCKPKVDP